MSFFADGGREVDQRVPVIGRGVDDDVHVLVLEQLAEVGELFGNLGVAGNCFAAIAAWLSSTSQTATMSPNRLALLASPRPIPPQPTSAIPGRSLALAGAGACVDADSSRSTNHRGNPVAAAIAVQWLRKVRREIWMRLDIRH